MTDREKVIKGLEDSLANMGCGYMDGVGELYAVSCENLQNAITLLKEQEPIEPITSDGDDLYWQPGDEDYACGACGEELAGSWWVYCPYCGRKVKWE